MRLEKFLHPEDGNKIYLVTIIKLLSPETLSSSSKSRIFLYNAHFALFVRMDDTITRTNASVTGIKFSDFMTYNVRALFSKHFMENSNTLLIPSIYHMKLTIFTV